MASRATQFSTGNFDYTCFPAGDFHSAPPVSETLQQFSKARKYFGHLATLRHEDADVWLCLSVCCAMAEEFDECSTAVSRATGLLEKGADDVRVKFCTGEFSMFEVVFYLTA